VAGKGAVAKTNQIDELQDEIAVRLWDNDETVVETILRSYGPTLVRCLHSKYKCLLTLEDVEELVADAVLILWRDRKQYQDKWKVRTVLYRIADCDAKDLVSKGWQKVRQREATGVEEFLASHPARTPTADVVKPNKKREQLLNDVREAMESLPSPQREILWAKAMAPDGEVTAGMIANELGIPTTTVRTYLKRAKESVAKKLKGRIDALQTEGGVR
jgi:RNA polymerase sigma factor (sigma-70 family)